MDSVQNKNSQKEGNSLLIQEAKDDTMRFLKEQLVRLEQVKRMSSRTIFAHEKSLINAFKSLKEVNSFVNHTVTFTRKQKDIVKTLFGEDAIKTLEIGKNEKAIEAIKREIHRIKCSIKEQSKQQKIRKKEISIVLDIMKAMVVLGL